MGRLKIDMVLMVRGIDGWKNACGQLQSTSPAQLKETKNSFDQGCKFFDMWKQITFDATLIMGDIKIQSQISEEDLCQLNKTASL